MDPHVAWRNLAKAIEEAEWHQAAAIADDLLEWFAGGGFPPRISGIEVFDLIVAKATCQAIARWEVE